MRRNEDATLAALGVIAALLEQLPTTNETQEAVEALDILSQASMGMSLRQALEFWIAQE